jgi:hypothetical protein
LEALVIVVMSAAVGGIILTAIRASQRQARLRTEALERHARSRGWTFHDRPALNDVPRLGGFELFQQGRKRTVTNLMAGEHRGFRIAVFDYSYVTGAGKSQTTWRQTVVSVHSHALDLPAFSVRPEHTFHRIAELFGAQDIDLDEKPEFSRRYLLRGQDEAAVRSLFTSAAADFLERCDRCCTAGEGSILFLWRPGRRARPEEIEDGIAEAEALAERLADADARRRGAGR